MRMPLPALAQRETSAGVIPSDCARSVCDFPEAWSAVPRAFEK